MKTLLRLMAILSLTLSAQAGEAHTFKSNGVSLTLHGDWKNTDKSSFGYVVKRAGDQFKKIKIHASMFQGVTLKEALEKTSERTKKYSDVTVSVSPVKTNSGIEVIKASVAKRGGKVYLERYFCLKPKGKIICICVHSFGNQDYSKSIEKAISQSLTLTK